jgi:hypothetical protein
VERLGKNISGGNGTRGLAALQDLRLRFAQASANAMAAKSGCAFAEGVFSVPFFNRCFQVRHPEGEVGEPSAGTPPYWLQVIFLYYLTHAPGVPLADRWVAFRELPNANPFAEGFGEGPLRELARVYGRDADGFREACQRLGGEAISRTGDAAFRFLAFPRVALALVLYLADEEMAATATLLYDAAAGAHLQAEHLNNVGGYLNAALIASSPR